MRANAPLAIWSNAGFPEAAMRKLREGVGEHRLGFATVKTATVLQSGPPDAGLLEAEIAFGQPEPEGILKADRLRWVHLTSAGYARYDRAEFRAAAERRGLIVTNSSHVYDEPCAQHAFAAMLAFSRRLPWAWMNQSGAKAWPQGELRRESFLLRGQRVQLLGFGAIARRLVEMLEPFRLDICALRRTQGTAEGVEIIAESDLDGRLALADHVVNLLPENAATSQFVNAARFAAMKRGAFFYNIGRGTTVDQEALRLALESGHVEAAYLDVTDPEPLPPESPLWTARNCFITPHTAGGHRGEEERLVEHFLDNLRVYEKGGALKGRVM